METTNKIILIPTDFSEACRNAINHGAEIARFLRYKVGILHVINKETKAYLKKENLDVSAIDKKLETIAKEVKKEYRTIVETISIEGSIFKTIDKVSREIKADLVLLGTHGKVGIQHLTGSYALKVVTSLSIPTIVVQKRSFDKGYKKIVFPISEDSEPRQKVKWAVMIAKLFRSKIHLYKMHENNAIQKSKLDIITNQIKEVFDKNNVTYVEEIAAKQDNFAKQVIDYSILEKADLILIMTKAEEFTPSFLLGPWDERIMFNDAQIPVMCINPRELNFIVIG